MELDRIFHEGNKGSNSNRETRKIREKGNLDTSWVNRDLSAESGDFAVPGAGSARRARAMRMSQMRNKAVGISIIVVIIVAIDGRESGGEGEADNEEQLTDFLAESEAGFDEPTFEAGKVEPIGRFNTIGDGNFDDGRMGEIQEVDFEHRLDNGADGRDQVGGRATGRRATEKVVGGYGEKPVRGVLGGDCNSEQGDLAEFGEVPNVESVWAE